MLRPIEGRRGSGTSRGGGPRPGGRGGFAPQPTKVCQHFLRGRCNYGASCKYSHDREHVKRAREEEASTPRETHQAREDYFDFKRQVRRRGLFISPASSNMWMEVAETWNLALKILDSPNREWHQSVARDLADDEVGGPDFIQRTIELCTTLGADGNCLKLARAFLRVITHQSMLRSLSVDSFLGTIYRMVAGSNGDRGIVFFSDLNRRLSGSSESPKSFLALAVLSLYELFRRERKGLLNDALPRLLDALREKAARLASLAEEPGPDSVDLDAVGMQIDIIRRMMDGARGGLSEGETAQAITVGNTRAIGIQSTFPSEVVVPGGKHDNDFADITKIQIFPTLGEITCDVSEYLPTTDFTQPHFLRDPVRRHIDSAFRLLRHDIFGPLKQVIGALLAQRNAADAVSSNRFITGNIKAHIYSGAGLQHVLVDKRDGFEAIASFTTPPQVRKLTLPDQQRWWQASSRLEPGGLVCFVSARGNEKSFLMFVVTEKNTGEIKEGQNKSTLVSDRFKPAVKVKLASETRENLAVLNRMYVDREEGLLVELPGLIPDTFVPILGNLQRMVKDGDLAFRQWILPSSIDNADDQPSARIPPPAYARKPGFKFRLRTITRDGQPTLSVNPAECTGDIATPETLEAATGLDPGQSASLIAALTREYALIQGPPGTGKSYVGVQLVRVLLDHKHEANLGPILVICYTNHALDQFLKHLLDVGVDKIIRIGGQSRAEELEGKNLRVVSQETSRTQVEQRILGKSYSEAEASLENAGHHLKRVHQARRNKPGWRMLEPFLSRRYPRIARQFGSQWLDEDGFELADGRDPRWALAGSWISELTELQSDRVFEMVSAARHHREAIQRVHDDVSCRTLLRADVVGVTTTGLARNINMLCRLGVKVIVCEEAAEVMEPHLISALMPGVEHFIQIGDHRQLRPQIQNYLQFSMETAVGRAYQLDRSQFERRAVGEPGLRALPVAQLKVQRRMRPEISRLIRRVYPDLVDHDCVKNLPSVVGMRDNLFWLDHDHPEDGKDDGARAKSHSNPWEVSMAKALIQHLVRQGEYKSTDIALLTPYTGQLQKLRASLGSDFEVFLSDRDLETLAKEGFEETPEEEPGTENTGLGLRKAVEKKRLLQTIRLATVDNFQGEEAKVVVVSLVRSNSNAKVGFLRTENRINVLLSRAQHGMYLIGNAKTYENVPMWADVLQQLRAGNAVGTSIALCCPRHPDTQLLCSEPRDFTVKSPEGGCSLPCDKRLEPCGHRCPAPCHSQRLHDAFDCLEPCPRLRSTCQHPCPKLCGQVCGPCNVKVDGVKLPCGHVRDKVLCHQTLDLKSIRCSQPVVKEVPGCGHSVSVPCYRDVGSEIFRCPTKCIDKLECGHQCPGTCGSCRTLDGPGGGVVAFRHRQCDKRCDRPYGTCNHRCSKTCHEGESCGTCPERCEVRCPHSRCHQECREPCTPCIEKCAWRCEHRGSCSLPCAAPCNRLPCEKRCDKTLQCGHRCPSFCGEECPQQLCQICCTRGDVRVDLMEFKTYHEIDLDETPIVVLGCGHFFTGETLDGLVGMKNVYTTDNLGNYNGLRELSGELMSIPTCPDCRVPIRQFATRRYNRVVNKAVLDETSKRFLVGGREKLAELEKKAALVEKKLSDSTGDTTYSPDVSLGKKISQRYKPAIQLEKESAALRKSMEAEHQPTKKLFDAVLTFQRLQRERSLEEKLRDLTFSEPQIATPELVVYDRQITLKAHRLQLRLQEAMLRDTFILLSRLKNSAILTNIPVRHPDKRSARFLKQCRDLIDSATSAKLPRLVIETILSYARVAELDGWYRRAFMSQTAAPTGNTGTTTTTTTTTNNNNNNNNNNTAAPLASDGEKTSRETAIGLLDRALDLCATIPGPDGDAYRAEVEETRRLFSELPHYEEVTPAEIAAIKAAMVRGAGGLATHSGHWYTCRNGHPFAIGECGMPMERARCPECGEVIGGTNHTPVEGVERDMRMESA
ncbi:uncharacterized protein P884DRAFT_280455 [Thermothelomyces heterothallicus CBS 202.75]|uniref:uncharacterized protein n=1 Tax=Thermothelomyces heterothallicus CBS 202.75 TaxID=1149848 RepID=UPI0037438AC0